MIPVSSTAEPPLLLALDLTGTFAFALNGAITGLEAARLDIVGMLTLGMVTACRPRSAPPRPAS